MFFTVVLLVVIFIIYWYRKQKSNEFWKHLLAIPGPPTYPIVGNTQGISKTAGKVNIYVKLNVTNDLVRDDF